MTTSFYNGITGLKSFQTGIDVWSNNISNINTIGYKESIPEFAALFSKTLSTSPITSDIGVGSYTFSTAMDTSQGNLISTDNKLDLAIQGEGWFQVQNNNQTFFTRSGSFTKDANGDIVLDDGSYLLGAMAGNLIPTDNGYEIDINTPTTNLPLTQPLSKINLPNNVILPAIPTTQVSLFTNLENDYAISKTSPATLESDFSALYSSQKTALNVVNGQSFVYGFGDNLISYNSNLLSTEICLYDDETDGNSADFDFFVNNTQISVSLPDGSTKKEIQNALLNELSSKGIQAEITDSGIKIFDQKEIIITSNTQTIPNSAAKVLAYNEDFNTIQDLINQFSSLASVVSADIAISLNEGKIEISNNSSNDIKTYLLKTSNSNDAFINNLGNLSASLPQNSSIASNQFLKNTQTFAGDYITADSTKNTLSFTFTKEKVTSSYSLWKADIQIIDPENNIISSTSQDLTFDVNGNLLYPKEITIFSPQQTTINLDLTAYTTVNPSTGINYGYNQNGTLSSPLRDYQILQDGKIEAMFENGHSITIGQIPIFHFQNDQGLENIGANLFRATDNSNAPILYEDNGEYLSTSLVLSNKLETSNVNFSQAMTELIITQKAFSSSAKAVTTSDEMIKRAIDLKRG